MRESFSFRGSRPNSEKRLKFTALSQKQRENFSLHSSRPNSEKSPKFTTLPQKRRSIKKIAFLTILILLCNVYAFAQDEKKMAVGLGLEWNMNSHEYFAGGAVLSVDYNLFQSFAVGLSVTASSNFTVFTALEPAAMFRWYPLGKDHTGFFVQADAGVYLYMEDAQTVPMFLGGLRTGLRLPLGQSFYIEPYGRAGYPFAFGIGVSVGMRFLPERKKAGSAAEIPDEIFVEEPVVEETAEEPEAKEAEHVQGRYYIVQRGDTLSRIAFIEYGNGYWWPLIAAANSSIQNPHLIYPGQRLYIPPITETE